MPLPHVERLHRTGRVVPDLFRHVETVSRLHVGQHGAHAADIHGNEDVAHRVQRPGGGRGGFSLHPPQRERRGYIQAEGVPDTEKAQGPRHVQPGAAGVQPGQKEGGGTQPQQSRHHAHPQGQPAFLHQRQDDGRTGAEPRHQHQEYPCNSRGLVVHDVAHELHRSHAHPANTEDVAQGGQQPEQKPPVSQHTDVQQRRPVGHAGDGGQHQGTESAIHPAQDSGSRPAVRFPVNEHHQDAHAPRRQRQEGEPVKFPVFGNLRVGDVQGRQNRQQGGRRAHDHKQPLPVPILDQQASSHRACTGSQPDGTQLHSHRRAAALRRQRGIDQARSVNQGQAASRPLKETGQNHDEEMVRRQSRQRPGQHQEQCRPQRSSQSKARPQVRRHGEGQGRSQRTRRSGPGNVQGTHDKGAGEIGRGGRDAPHVQEREHGADAGHSQQQPPPPSGHFLFIRISTHNVPDQKPMETVPCMPGLNTTPSPLSGRLTLMGKRCMTLVK